MLKVYLGRYREGLRSASFTWSNVRESVAELRVPVFFHVYPHGNVCEVHFDVMLPYVAIDLLKDLDSSFRSYQFAYIDHFEFES